MHLALVILAVEDLARSRDFYATILPEWCVEVDETVYVELRDPAGSMRLGLYDRAGFSRNTIAPVAHLPAAGVVTSTELYFVCDQVEESLDRLRRAGATPLSGLAPRGWGDDAAYFRDPDGNVVVVARPSASP